MKRGSEVEKVGMVPDMYIHANTYIHCDNHPRVARVTTIPGLPYMHTVERGSARTVCSPVPMFPGTYMFPEPMFPGSYVPRYRCSPIFVL